MKKSKTWVALLLALTMLLSLVGCGSQSNDSGDVTPPTSEQTPAEDKDAAKDTAQDTAQDSQEMRTVVDATGEEIQVPAHPQAMVILAPVFPNMIYALQGHLDNVIAIPKSAYTGWESSLMRELYPELEGVNTTIASGSGTNMEELAAAKPDLVLCWATATDTISQLKDLGIPVAAFNSAKDLDSLKSLVTMLGDVLNCQEKTEKMMIWYDEVEAYISGKADQVSALSDEQKPRVLTFSTLDDLSVYASGVNAWMVENVGGQNIVLTGESAERSAPTMEEVLVYDPEIILLSNWDDSTPEDLYENRIEGQDWSNVSAVKNHRVYKVPIGLYRWTPPNTIEKPLYYLYLASVIQPEIFEGIDMRQEISDFISEYLDVALTEEQLDFVLHADLYE